MRKKSLIIIGLLIALAVVATLVLASPSAASKLEEAIAVTPKGIGKGMIDPAAQPGFLGIPGAPKPFWVWGLLWGIWVGWIFSSVGAFGGIMAGVGHITIFGLAGFGKAFKKTSPVMNKLFTDSIRVSNQWIVGLSALISSTNYYRMGRIVLPLGLFLAGGSILGAFLIPVLTAGKIKLSSYIGYFGLCVFAIAFVLYYETTAKGQEKRKAARAAARAFEAAHMKKAPSSGPSKEVSTPELAGVRVHHWGLTKISFTFYGVEFSFNPVWPVIGGFFIAALAAFLGIGGGFLYVPFLTSVAGLPMYIVAGTSAVAVLIGMIVSIFSYIVIKGVPVDFFLIGVEMVGVAAGSFLGPHTSKYIPEIWLKRLFVLLAVYVGIRYTSKGFLGFSLVPPF